MGGLVVLVMMVTGAYGLLYVLSLSLLWIESL